MSNQEDKAKHSRRIKKKVEAKKKRARVRSVIAKKLITDPQYHQRIVLDKRGKERNLDMSHLEFIQAIQELNDD